jgi:hypothetical protein
MSPVIGVICRDPFAIPEPGLKLKSASLASSKVG